MVSIFKYHPSSTYIMWPAFLSLSVGKATSISQTTVPSLSIVTTQGGLVLLHRQVLLVGVVSVVLHIWKHAALVLTCPILVAILTTIDLTSWGSFARPTIHMISLSSFYLKIFGLLLLLSTLGIFGAWTWKSGAFYVDILNIFAFVVPLAVLRTTTLCGWASVSLTLTASLRIIRLVNIEESTSLFNLAQNVFWIPSLIGIVSLSLSIWIKTLTILEGWVILDGKVFIATISSMMGQDVYGLDFLQFLLQESLLAFEDNDLLVLGHFSIFLNALTADFFLLFRSIWRTNSAYIWE